MVETKVGDLNKIWKRKKLEDLCELVRGTEPGSNAYFNEQKEDYIQFIRIGDITGKINSTKFVKKKSSDLTIVNSNEILISFDGTPGVVVKGWVGSISSGIRVIRNIKPEILRDFLFYYLQTNNVQQIIKSYATGITILHASRSIPHIRVLLPPLPIQQKIVERLDAIRKAQELNDKQIALANELFQSLLHKELDPKGKNWEVKRLGEICEVNPKTNLDISKGKIKYVEMAAINANSKEIKYFLERPINKISSGVSKFKNDDIIFARITPCTENGKLAFVENCHGVCTGSTEFHVLRANQDGLLARFLFYWLIIPKIRDMAVASMIGSTGRQRVPAGFFHYIKISIPPIKIQRKIVEKLSAVQEYKKKLIEQKQKLKELFESCLDKAMKVELI